VRLADLRGRRVVVLGVGIDVAAVLPMVLAAEPASLVVVDDQPERATATLVGLRIPALAETAVLRSLADAPMAEVAVRSPGYSPYQTAVRDCVKAGMQTVTPLGLWLTERGDRPSVAITGTKGKSSTSVLTQLALEGLGHRAVVLGNIGVPPWSRPPHCDEVAVLEISSYQAADLPVTAPVALLTALGEDHVSWHGSVGQYLADKCRVFTAPTASGRRWCAVPAGLYLPGLFGNVAFTRIDVPADDLRASNARLAAAAALTVTGGDAGRSTDLAAHLLDRYPDLPGRFSTVATVRGVDYVDDALASAPLGLAAALRTLAGRPVAAIVGGSDRGAALDPVLAAIAARRRPTLVLCVDDASPLAHQYRAAGAEADLATDLESAVVTAATRMPPGAAVVFSPGMPTPRAQGTWADRSARFRAAVDRLGSGTDPTEGASS
jgi:UDP-N-acetylmuramoylalanine-D-glutamate ligase